MRMGLVNSPMSIFDHAISDAGIKSDTSSCVVNDQTRLSGRESWEGVQIGKSERQVDIECGDKNRCLSSDEAEDLLIGAATATPISQIAHDSQKMIEGGSK